MTTKFFNDPAPWLKARLCPYALKGTSPIHDRRREFVAAGGDWQANIEHNAPRAMAEYDALPPDWRAYCRDNGMQATKAAIRSYGKRSVRKATADAILKDLGF